MWQTLVDFPRMPDWNPFIRQIAGEVKEGARLQVHLQPPGGRAMTFRPAVLKVRPNRELRWLGRFYVRGLVDGEHIFELHPMGANRTRFVQREEFRGLLVPLMPGRLSSSTGEGFVAMNEALKIVAERG